MASRSQLRGIQAELLVDEAAFNRSLVQALQNLEVRTQDALWKLGLGIQNDARRLCPVDTGRLRSSIQATKVGDQEVTVGTNVEYAAFVEFGTRFQAAQPYLRPALASQLGLFPGLVSGAL